MAVRNKSSTFEVYHASSSSDSSTSSSSSASSDTPLRRFNRLLRTSVAKHWGNFRRVSPDLTTRGRSISDAGLCSIVDNDSDVNFVCISDTPRRSCQALGVQTATIPRLYISSAGGSLSAVALEQQSDCSDGERPRSSHHLRVPTPAYVGQSTGNFASGGAAGGGCGAPRSAPSTPLQLDPHPRSMKYEKQAVKPLSSSVPSVRALSSGPSVGGGGVSDASEGKPPSKARQKKFLRHFPQVGPEEKVLNYYSCALVGDILLQGHLYITRNYFAFYSNVFGYVTKLLIPTPSVLRVTKEKMARIIPNAVGVCTRDERHVFGSLLSRDSTYKLMTQVWKSARVSELAAPPPPKELRISEAELDASEYSVEDETSSAGGGDNTDGAHVKESTTGPPAGAAVIQPALLTGATSIGGFKPRGFGATILLMLLAAILTISAICLAVKVYGAKMNAEPRWSQLSSSEMVSELRRWRAAHHGRTAAQLHHFLHNNKILLYKVRQSLEALSGLILEDVTHPTLDVPNDTAFS